MPSTPCRAHCCPNLVSSRTMKGYCDSHAHLRANDGWQAWHRGQNTTERGYGQAWRKLRQQVMERDGYLCQVCKQQGRLTEATAVDHIKNKASGGTDDLDNLQAICQVCHRAKTQAESQCQRSG